MPLPRVHDRCCESNNGRALFSLSVPTTSAVLYNCCWYCKSSDGREQLPAGTASFVAGAARLTIAAAQLGAEWYVRSELAERERERDHPWVIRRDLNRKHRHRSDERALAR